VQSHLIHPLVQVAQSSELDELDKLEKLLQIGWVLVNSTLLPQQILQMDGVSSKIP
jgi:hypothetical protein